jgi:hypothetical protein
MKYRRCVVRVFDPMKFVSELTLNTRHYDTIGFTEGSLDDYMKKHILTKDQWYYVAKDTIRKIPRRS